LKAPFAPAFFAISSRAFLSVVEQCQRLLLRGREWRSKHTGSLLELVGLVLLVLLGDLLLGLLVVDGVGTGW